MVTAIEGRALQSEGNRPAAWSSLRTEFVEQTPWRNTNVESSTQHGIVSMPSLFQAPPSMAHGRTLPSEHA